MNIIRYYNQNKKSLWIICATIIVIIVVVQMANFMAKLQHENDQKEKEQQQLIKNEQKYKENPDISVEIKNEEVKEDNTLIIDQFYRYCNAGKVEDAYNLISSSCKKNKYTSLENFIKVYYNAIFTNTKLYSKEQYAGDTYKIKLYDDALSTGKVSGSYIEDYVTIINENGELKLNISKFIKETDLDISNENEYLKVNIKKKTIYKEYVEYILTFKNLTNKDIAIDSLKDLKSVYITNESVNFYAALNEKTENELIINSNTEKQISLKFNMEYNKYNSASRMVFTNIILDKQEYDLSKNKDKFEKIIRMDIKL